jgi:hypothetical protein
MSKNSLEVSIETALQGLAFWISYRQILHHWYPLNEGALVAEFVNLLNAKRDQNLQIRCEVPYGKPRGPRMDVEILRKDAKDYSRIAAIEFKRNFAGKKLIYEDIEKLAELKDKEISRFLIVVSERKLPKEYVNKDGEASGKILFHENGFSAKVVRVLKSTSAFRWQKGGKTPPKANYCCLIEIKPSNNRSSV